MLATVVLIAAGGLLTEIGPWYRGLIKPRLQPPDWLFGPAWTLILGMACASAVIAWSATDDPAWHLRIVLLFGANWLLHLLWSPLFFKFHRPDWALLEVPLLWLSVLALIVGLAPLSPLAAWLFAPYLAWVSFAAWLNWAIVRLNGPFATR